MRRRRALHIAIIGAGKVGSVLGKVLTQRGASIVAVISRSQSSARRAGRFLGCRNTSTHLSALPSDTDVIFITTPHAAIEGVAHSLAHVEGLDFNHLSVCHISGMLTAKVLTPLQRRGAKVFSFHPLQTFPRDFPAAKLVQSARGIYYGVDGPPEGIRMARRLARILDGKVIIIPPTMRAFYHAACVLASNHLTAMLGILKRMFDALETSEKRFYPVFEPILMATLKNVAATSPREALSGPVARGGIETVAEHFRSIKHYCPELIPYFAQLSVETLKLAMRKGSITDKQAKELMNLIRSYTHSEHLETA